MAGPINNLDDLIRLLEAAVKGAPGSRYIVLERSLLDAAGDLVDDLALPSLRIDQHPGEDLIRPDKPQGFVAIVGSAAVFDPAPKPAVRYDVTVKGRVVTSTNPPIVTFDLQATPAAPQAPWSFAANFATLPKFLGAKDGEPGLVWQDSFFDDLGLAKPVFTVATYTGGAYPKGLAFTADLDPTAGTLGKHVGKYLQRTIALAGPIKQRAGKFPLIDLSGDSHYSVERVADVLLQLSTGDASGDDPAYSTADLVGKVTIGTSWKFQITGSVLQGDQTWVLTFTIDDPDKYSLANQFAALVQFLGLQALPLPAGIDAFASMYLASVTVGISPGESGPRVLNMLAASIKYKKDWPLPLPGGTISDVAIVWEIADPFGSPFLVGSISGKFKIGNLITLAAQADISGATGASLSSVAISAELAQPDNTPASIDAVVEHFTGFNPQLNVDVTALSLEVNTGERTLLFYGAIGTNLPIVVPLLKMTGASFGVQITPNRLTGSLGGGFTFGSLPLAVLADYRGSGAGWLLKGGVPPGTSPPTLGEWLKGVDSTRFADVPAAIGAIQLRGLQLSYDTSLKKFDFDTTVGWAYTLASFNWDIEAQFQITAVSKQPKNEYSGKLRGTVQVNALKVSVIYAFDVLGNQTVTFAIDYKGRTLTAVLSKNKKNEQILTVAIGNVSFGDIVGFLVDLVEGGSGFRLTAPWNVLYDVSFNNLSLVINLTTRTVGITYRLGLNLGVAEIETIGLTYVNKAGKTTVDITITGKFAEQEYPDSDPLSWDLLNDPPPAPPGKGTQLLDLRYLGFGQNIAFRDARSFTSVLEVIKALEEDFKPVDPDGGNPLGQLPAIRFSGSGNWLIGADFTIMETVSLAGIFNDPELYGIRIGLAGEKAGALAGLAFEILYKKVTDDIGVYLINLKVPDAMRQIEVGAASITLPNIGLEIYTNGNFRVDVGFPVGTDFSGSFSLQLFPFVGFGGFYFALLNGQTSRTVPRITNGDFSPVIEFGIGLSVGVGKSINRGVLKAGVTVAVTGILEGTVGWFNPSNSAVPSDRFVRVTGTIAIVGKMFGEVDFVIIQVRVSVTATASAVMVIESYKPTEIEMSVAVEVSASLKILFVTIHFSFSLQLDLSFTIGQAGTSPWIVASGGDVEQPRLLLGQRTRHRARRITAAQLLADMRAEGGEQVRFDWTSLAGARASPEEIDIIVVPSVTVADRARLAALAASRETGNTLRIVVPLYIPNGIAPDAVSAEDVQTAARDGHDSAFNKLLSAVLEWTIGAIDTDAASPVFGAAAPDEVTIAHLEEIAAFLADPANRRAAFSYANIENFLQRNFILRVSSPLGPTGQAHFAATLSGAASPAEAQVSTTIFPIIPALTMAPQDQPEVDFGTHHPVGADYIAALDAYFRQLTNDPTRDTADRQGPTGVGGGANGAAVGAAGASGPTASMATVIFESYFAMLAAGVTREAISLMNAYPYRATGEETLAQIAEDFGGLGFELTVNEGETLEHIAGRFGVSLAAIRRANDWTAALVSGHRLAARSTVSVPVGVSVETIAAANADYPLTRGITLGIDNVRYQLRTGDSLEGVAGRFGIPDVRAIFAPRPGPVGIAGNPNASSPNILAAGAGIWLAPAAGPTGATFGPTFPYRVDTGDLLGPTGSAAGRVAARYTVRNQANLTWPFSAWYRQRLVQLNPNLVWDQIHPGMTVAAPVAGITGGLVNETSSTVYAVKAGDSIDLLAAYLALEQIGGDVPDIQAAHRFYEEFLRRIRPQSGIVPGQVIALPGFTRSVQPGDSLETLAERFGVQVPGGALDAEGLAWANRGSSTLLQPLGVLDLPQLEYFTATGPQASTLGDVAQRYNLTLDEVAAAVAGVTGIFQPYGASAGGPTMTIPDVASRKVDRLRDDLIAFGKSNRVAAMVSRFLMHGLRVAKPTGPQGWNAADGTELWGLYEMIGQQIAAPASLTANYEVTLAKGATADWIRFATSPLGRAGAARAAAGPSGDLSSLPLGFTGGYFSDAAPSPTFSPQILRGPSALPLFDETPTHYGLQKSLHWQASVAVPLPGATGASGPIAGEPTIWPFSDALAARVAGELRARGATAQTRPYELAAARAGGPAARLNQYAWASAVPIRIQRQIADGRPMSNSYLVLGADETGRDTLLQAWTYLEARSSPRDRLYLLYAPDPSMGNPLGLASAKVDPDRTFILKSNLSTVTHSGVQRLALRAAATLDYVVSLATPGPFLRMLWEASITASGGFYLNYATADAQGLPDNLFANGDVADVWLVLILDDQAAARPVRGLRAFNNCAVLGENIASTGASLWVQLDPAVATRADLVRVANVPAGSVAFELARRDPTPGMSGASGPLSPAEQLDLTRSLYSLLGYNVAGNDFFDTSNEAVPISPMPPGATGATGQWIYRQTVPVSNVGRTNAMPVSRALPDAAGNPYRGITGPRGVSGPASRATLDFRFHDVFGNQTISTEPLRPLDITVGYTDPLIGIGGWPGAAFDYTFRADKGGPVLDAALSLQTINYVAGAGLSYGQASARAASDSERYRQITYQVQQRDAGFRLTSNLGDVALSGDALKAPMTAFVTKARLFTDAAAKLSQVQAKTQAGQTLEQFARAYSTTVEALLEANARVLAQRLFDGAVVMPKVIGAPALNTLRLLVQNETSSGTTIDCGSRAVRAAHGPRAVRGVRAIPRVARRRTGTMPVAAAPAPGDPLTVEELATNNRTAPLTTGLVLRTARRVSQLASGSSEQQRSAAAVAAALSCPVYAVVRNPEYPADPNAPQTLAVGLVVDNFLDTILAAGVTLTMRAQGKEVKVETSKTIASFDAAYKAFTTAYDALSIPITEGDFAVAIAGTPGLIVERASVAHASFIVPSAARTIPGEHRFSLADMPSAAGSTDDLARWNRAAPGFFATAVPVYINYHCVTPGESDTVAALAEQSRVNQATWAAFNAGSALKGAVELDIPALTYWEAVDAARSYAGFTPGAQSSLATIAGLFGLSGPTGAAAIAAINREIPGIFADGAVVAGATARPLDSLQSLWAGLTGRFATFDDFVSAIAGQTGIYRQNGVVAAPLPIVPGPQSPSWDDLAKAYNIGGEAAESGALRLVAANRSLHGFLRAGALVEPPSGATGLGPATVGPFDTVDTLLQRFAKELADAYPGATIALADLVRPNAAKSDLTGASGNFLLPPSATRLVSPFTPVIPPRGVTAPQDKFIFPCLVDMTLTRDRGLVTPEFQGATAVFESKTPLVARGVAQQADTLQLDQFAVDFEQAFANEHLKAAVSKRHGLAADAADRAHIWGVNFGPSGVAKVAISVDRPQFYALAPLTTESQAGTITVRDYVSGQGLGATASRRFDGIDLDAWMQQLLDAVDLYLTPAYAVPSAWQVGSQAMQARPAHPQTGPVGLANAPAGPRGLGETEPQLPAASLTGGALDFDAIVAAKAEVAKSLRGKVSAILDIAGATAGPYLESAREALYQQMLTTLSSAYSVDAIVQYPVGVTSHFPSTGPLLPPRLSGKVVPDLPRVAPAAPTIEAAAAAVAAPFFATLLVDARGIWKTDAIVTYPSPRGATMAIRPEDTLRSIAAHFDVPTDPGVPGYWRKWSQFIDSSAGGIGAEPLLNPDVALPVVNVRRAVDRGDTLALMADFAGIDVGSFAEAIERDRGVFTPAWTISLGASSYRTTGNETLAETAAALGTPVTVREVADRAMASLTGPIGPLRTAAMLTERKVLHSAQVFPEVTLSTAKVSLAPEAGAPPHLTFFMSTAHEARFKKLFLNLKYVINEIEFDIREVAQAGDYRASSWLTFILPIGSGRGAAVADTTIEQVQVPLPLRSYPTPPLMAGQSAVTSDPQATTIPAARRWDYRFDFETRSAGQDTNHVEVAFNRQRAGNGLMATASFTTEQLFVVLAQFIAVWPELKQDLTRLPGVPFAAQNATVRVAVHTLRQLVEGVAGVLSRPGAEFLGAQWPEETYAYRLRTALDAAEQMLRDLTLVPEPPLGKTAIAGPVVWPSAVFVRTPTAPTAGPDAGFVQLGGSDGFYTYPPGITAGRAITQRMLFRGRDVIRNKNAWSGAYVARNADLIAHGPLGPRGMTGPVATRDDFIYRTPIVRFVDPLTPFVINRNPIDVNGLTGPFPPADRRPLSAHLTNMIDAILELEPWSQTKAESLLQLLVNYAFAAAGGEGSGQDMLLAATPIRLVPTRPVDESTRNALVNELAANLRDWYRTRGPTGAAGYLSFEASVYTGGDASGMTGSQKPILSLGQLVLPVDKVDWSRN